MRVKAELLILEGGAGEKEHCVTCGFQPASGCDLGLAGMYLYDGCRKEYGPSLAPDEPSDRAGLS